MTRVLLVLIFAAAPAAYAQAEKGGVATEWDLRKLLENLTFETEHLRSVLGQVKTEAMVANGAPPTYMAQWKTAQTELQYTLGSVEALAKQPERLPVALDAFFRMQAMEATLGSVFEGMRKYQNPALADLLQSVVNENTTNRDRLRQYIQDLAVQKEQEFQVMDKEAQRCRNTIMRESGGGSARERRK